MPLFPTAATAVSLAISVVGALGWVVSYAAPPGWQVVDVEHHPSWLAGMTDEGKPAGVASRRPDPTEPVGFWRAWWIYVGRGHITLLKQEASLGRTGGAVTGPPTRLFVVKEVPASGDGKIASGAAVALCAMIKDRDSEATTWADWFGCYYERDRATPVRTPVPQNINATLEAVTVPWWLITAIGLTMPLLRLRHSVVLRGRREGHCLACGYDLRASPDRCPECGCASGGALASN
jgi:hypothetical protein